METVKLYIEQNPIESWENDDQYFLFSVRTLSTPYGMFVAKSIFSHHAFVLYDCAKATAMIPSGSEIPRGVLRAERKRKATRQWLLSSTGPVTTLVNTMNSIYVEIRHCEALFSYLFNIIQTTASVSPDFVRIYALIARLCPGWTSPSDGVPLRRPRLFGLTDMSVYMTVYFKLLDYMGIMGNVYTVILRMYVDDGYAGDMAGVRIAVFDAFMRVFAPFFRGGIEDAARVLESPVSIHAQRQFRFYSRSFRVMRDATGHDTKTSEERDIKAVYATMLVRQPMLEEIRNNRKENKV